MRSRDGSVIRMKTDRRRCAIVIAKMPEKITAEDLLGNIMETIADNIPKQKSISFFEGEQSGSVSSQINRLFGHQKPVHHLLGGGKSADVLLWRNKKISASVLTAATVIWILFEWLNYNFLTLVCLVLVLGMIAQFFWSNASGLMNRSSARVPRLVLPDELFVNVARSVGVQVNQALIFLQDVSCGGNLKQFLMSVDYGRMTEILVQRAASPDEFTRLTAITWINEFVKLGGDQLVPYYADILGAILPCILDKEEKIRGGDAMKLLAVAAP